ncbi:MAG: hypothetical protein ACRD2A_16850, partial [Vicinamibacterales bacterium]
YRIQNVSNVNFSTHYTSSQGMKPVTIEATRPAPRVLSEPFVREDADVCGFFGEPTTIEVRLPQDFRFLAANKAQSAFDAARAKLTYAGNASPRMGYTYETPIPLGSDITTFDAGIYRVYVLSRHATAARELAERATPLVREAAGEAGVAMPIGPLPLAIVAETVPDWAAGTFDVGVINVKDRFVLDNGTDWPFFSLKTLVHETFHALTIQYEYPSNITWFIEGAARHSERVVDRAIPHGARQCTFAGVCDPVGPPGQSHRGYYDLADRYRANHTFNESWIPTGNQTETVELYEDSDLRLAAYVARFGAAAYANVWDEVLALQQRTTFDCCGPPWLASVFLRNAGGNLTLEELYYPHRALLRQDEAAFAVAVSCLVYSATERPNFCEIGLPARPGNLRTIRGPGFDEVTVSWTLPEPDGGFPLAFRVIRADLLGNYQDYQD